MQNVAHGSYQSLPVCHGAGEGRPLKLASLFSEEQSTIEAEELDAQQRKRWKEEMAEHEGKLQRLKQACPRPFAS